MVYGDVLKRGLRHIAPFGIVWRLDDCHSAGILDLPEAGNTIRLHPAQDHSCDGFPIRGRCRTEQHVDRRTVPEVLGAFLQANSAALDYKVMIALRDVDLPRCEGLLIDGVPNRE